MPRDHEYTISHGRRAIASVSRAWVRGPETYGVEVAPGQDDALILAVTVCITLMSGSASAPPRPASRWWPRDGQRGAGAQAAQCLSGGRGWRRWCALPGAWFWMGTSDRAGVRGNSEGPVRQVRLDAFWIGATAVTNAQFGAFVGATEHVTDAERFGWSLVFAGLLPADAPRTRAMPDAPWWRLVVGADWRHPEGLVEPRRAHGSPGGTRHVARRGRPTARRGGACPLRRRSTPPAAASSSVATHGETSWRPAASTAATCGRGAFAHNSLEDGYFGTCPADTFPPNGHGLHNAVGNVWEWCADWWSATWHRRAPGRTPPAPAWASARW